MYSGKIFSISFSLSGTGLLYVDCLSHPIFLEMTYIQLVWHTTFNYYIQQVLYSVFDHISFKNDLIDLPCCCVIIFQENSLIWRGLDLQGPLPLA